MDIYIKPATKIFITEKKLVTIKDVADIEAPAKVSEKVKSAGILNIKSDKKCNYVVSAIDIIKVITMVCPNATVNNVGQSDVIVSYDPDHNRRSPIITGLLILFVSATLLMGSATAIMSFHTDAQIPKVFKNYYKIFFGEEVEKPLLIDIPYSFGLAFGIIIFFNHFMGKKFSEEPTPIQVEMSIYETDVNDTIVDQLTEEKAERADEDA
jgi:stage V sporulation protein AA